MPPNLFKSHRIYTIEINLFEDDVDEQQAIRRLKKGDISGLEFIVQRHQLKALRTAFLITRDQGLAEDVVQESFIRVYRAIRSFDETRPFEPWFLRSVVNASVKMVRKSARQVEVWNDAEDGEWAQFSSGAESVEAQVEATEFQRQLWDSMRKLSPRQRAAIVQRYYLGMGEKEMAAVAGVARGTVKWLLNAARDRMRALLTERSEK
jgi:RNA polymerase sigma-70 factor (ECF subfamily)